MKKPIQKNLCKNISFSEKAAINIYTGSFYRVMNALMRGSIDEAVNSNFCPQMLTEKAKANHTIKETLLHIILAVSGLNKLPDYVPPLGSDGKPQKYLYRLESGTPESVLAKRKWAVLQGGAVTFEMGFISTAFSKPSFFGDTGILIKNLKGKKITPLSQYGEGEREVLLPPTQMQWKYCKEITGIYNNTSHLFLAKPVTLKTPQDSKISKSTYVKTIDPKDNLLYGIDTAMA